MPALLGQSIIASSTTSDKGGKEFSAINPATGEPIVPMFYAATMQQVDLACRSAGEAFASFRATSAAKRASFLRAIAANIDALVDTLVERMNQEAALPEARVRGETAR